MMVDWPFSLLGYCASPFYWLLTGRLHFRGALQITLLQRLSNPRVGLGEDEGLIEKKFKSSLCVDSFCHHAVLGKKDLLQVK